LWVTGRNRPPVLHFSEIADRIADEIDMDIYDFPGYEDWTLDERNYIRIREKAYRIAQHFKWLMEGGSL